MENQDLHLLPKHSDGTLKEGWMLLAEDAAFLNGDTLLPVTIMAIFVPGDRKIRWFYTILKGSLVLKRLDEKNAIELDKSWNPGSTLHKRLFTFVREYFTATLKVPDAPDWLNAQQVTDYCPDMLDPDTAYDRLMSNEYLYFSAKVKQDWTCEPSDDRYLSHFHAAEKEIANIAHLKCSEYLLVKREFFKAFFREICRSEKKIGTNGSTTTTSRAVTAMPAPISSEANTAIDSAHDIEPPSTPLRQVRNNDHLPAIPSTPLRKNRTDRNKKDRLSATPPSTRRSTRDRTLTPAPLSTASTSRRGNTLQNRERVRSDHAHVQWLENYYDFPNQRARRVVAAWREMGYLDESRFLDWVRAGGVFERIGDVDDGDSELGEGEGEGEEGEDVVQIPAALAARRRELRR